MATQWIKVESTTPDKPEVLRMARFLNLNPDEVFGKMMRFWFWVDHVSVDGAVDGAASQDVDIICRHVGFCDALVKVGWLVVDEANERLTIPNFVRHNGETAKTRALKGERQAKYRKRVDGAASTNVDNDELHTRLPDKIRINTYSPEPKKPAKLSIELPDWLPQESWNAWTSDRGARGKKITPHAAKLHITKLEQLRAQGNDPAAVISQSIENGWLGLFPLRNHAVSSSDEFGLTSEEAA